MWTHKESKWLVRGGRKVRCYLCGKKILKKDPFMFHENTGYYSHNFCIMEANTIDRNERRRAVKKIAVGAAVVGAMAAGAGKFIDISSQSKGSLNSPDTQTIITSQGLILPSLTSDPANPVAGQMWYRSDAGVTAHFDSIQNRVVYSSELNNGMVNVTSKGIINGLSVLPNDGTGGFGPDTTKGATAPGQYGGTYTETSGIQEGINFLSNGGMLALTSGTFVCSVGITMKSGIKVIGGGGPYGTVGSNANLADSTPSGAIIKITAAATNAITFPTPCIGVSFDDVTIQFASGLSSTGHGFTTTDSTGNINLQASEFNNVLVIGHDLSHYAFYFNTTLYLKCDHLYSNGGMVLHMGISSGNSIAPANSTFNNIQAVVEFSGTGNDSNVVELIDQTLVTFNFLQIGSTGSLTGTGQFLYISGCVNISINMPIIESGIAQATYYVNIDDSTNTIIINPYLANAGSGIVHVQDTSGSSGTVWIGYGSSSQTTVANRLMTFSSNTALLIVPYAVVTFDTGFVASTILTPVSGISPTTPSVPSSGTAQENTNPYAVDVYVYGGAVTEIQITRNGTAYTVLSVSTAIAMSGQHFPLNNLDSITITYSTAPTWEWLSD